MGLARVAGVIGVMAFAAGASGTTGACGANVVVDPERSPTSSSSGGGGSIANGGAPSNGGGIGNGGDTSFGGSTLTFATVATSSSSASSSSSGVTASSSSGFTAGSSATSSSGAVGCLPKAPSMHRPQPGLCTASTSPVIQCQSDAQCVAGNGFGSLLMGTCTSTGVCDFDQCLSDTDCPGTSICQCHGQGQNLANTCVDEGCRDDADCATGFCSPWSTGTCMPSSFDCHTCKDTCVDDSDCTASMQTCAFSPMLGYFTCQTVSFCAG